MKKGMSLIALAIYILGFITILGILIAFNVNVIRKTNDFVAKNTLNTEYIKFNMFFTALAKNNNYILADVDENGNSIIKIMKYGKNVITDYARDEETGEQYISGKHWENDAGENIGYVTYDDENKSIYYIKFEEGEYNTTNPILISDYVSGANFVVDDDSKSILVDLEYFGDNVEFYPNDITYVMGRGY